MDTLMIVSCGGINPSTVELTKIKGDYVNFKFLKNKFRHKVEDALVELYDTVQLDHDFTNRIVFMRYLKRINATGRDASGSGGTAAYSLGQVVYTTNSGTSATVSQGVQQAYEIFTIGIKETELNISLSVFPNPTIYNLTL